MSWIESHSVTSVPISSLVFDESPRLQGEDHEHVKVLAEVTTGLPPITVHRPTMRVIDGTHRVRAALLNGRSVIDARLIDCDENAAFVLAVKANVTHGLPLSQSDRAAAATRIILTHPQWSDRAVAAATALSDKTISRLRGRTNSSAAQSDMRLGRDGRLRPVDSGDRRQRAAVMFKERPEAGLREVARVTGLSPSTVRDVRQRMDRGEDPVPSRYQRGNAPSALQAQVPRPQRVTTVDRTVRPGGPVDRQVLLAQLGTDPSLRLSESGRRTLRWLHSALVAAEGLEDLGRGLPDHWAPVVADLARNCAATWSALADQLQRRTG